MHIMHPKRQSAESSANEDCLNFQFHPNKRTASVSEGAGVAITALILSSKRMDRIEVRLEKIEAALEMLTGALHQLDKRVSVIKRTGFFVESSSLLGRNLPEKPISFLRDILGCADADFGSYPRPICLLPIPRKSVSYVSRKADDRARVRACEDVALSGRCSRRD